MKIRLIAILRFVAMPLFVLCGVTLALGQAKVRPLLLDKPTQAQYKVWLEQDVRWIIRPDEKRAFLRLSNDLERDEFIRQFWVRRNPNPASAENKFKEEHYRRIAFADAHFATGEPGWKTDRGRVYIVFGPPDSMDSHPAAEGGAIKLSEIWHYQSIRVGWPFGPESDATRHTVQLTIIKNFNFRFVDECSCGQYRLVSPWPLAN